MKKLGLELITSLVLFFGIFLLAKQVDWISLLRVQEVRKQTEEKLGELLKEMLNKDKTACEKEALLLPVDSLLNRLCEANQIDPESIDLSVYYEEEVNAFALPGNQIVLYTGLMNAAENESALAGVIAHELAHLQKKHVMRRLIREMGVAVLLSAASGGAGETLTTILKELSSASYDRSMEMEADLTAADYLHKAGFAVSPFAAFLEKLDDKETPAFLLWISTHPSGKERSEEINKRYPIMEQVSQSPFLSPETWANLKNILHADSESEN